MSYENYYGIYKAYVDGTIIKPRGKAEFCFNAAKNGGSSYKLYVAGETVENYMKKCEPATVRRYHSICDALDRIHAVHDAFCLDFSNDSPEDFSKRCFKKLLWRPLLHYLSMQPVPENWKMGFLASGKNIKILKGGYLRMRADIRLLKPNVDRTDTRGAADLNYTVDIPEGTFDSASFFRDITVPHDTASVSVFFEGRLYSGELYIEKPCFSGDGYNLLPDFAPEDPSNHDFNWTGQYLSRKEWPKFNIELNGKSIFSGEVFERCHRASDWEIPIPNDALKENNTLTVELDSDYHDALPYMINELALLETDGTPFSLISANETAPLGGKAHLLIRTRQDNMQINLSTSPALSGEKSFFFEKAGLHAVALDALELCVDSPFTLSSAEHSVTGKIGAIIKKENDLIVTGSGDMVYIRQDKFSMDEFLSWYFSNHLGNLITIRPVYRWSGTKRLNEKVMQNAAALFNSLGVYYVHMADGRENPGLASCPPDELIDGEFYLGRQNHERDGQLMYWGNAPLLPEEAADYDMRLEIIREDGALTAAGNNDAAYVFGGKTYKNRSNAVPRDMNAAMEYTVDMLRKIANGAARHTGPSFAFKYFLEAGYKWVGAETMYSTMEILMAFLRGASAYGKNPRMGVHHAVQWSTSPHDRWDHYRRFRLALYSSYMLGATDINTEEGFYRMEEYYSRHNRHSECCKNHMAQQRDFYRYASRHTRSGKFYSNIAILHGRADGTNGFVPSQPWGWTDVPLHDSEKSWELLKVFYPDAVLSRPLYFHNFTPDKPLGYNSSSPLGGADIIPSEAYSLYSDYKVLAFLGYNLAYDEDLDELEKYAENGGTLILTLAHLTNTTSYDSITKGSFGFSEKVRFFDGSAPEFSCDTYLGNPVTVCRNTVHKDIIKTTDSGAPFLLKYSVGKGSVLLFNAMAYPADPAVRPLYEEVLLSEKRTLNAAEEVWAKTDHTVEFTVFKQDDGSTHIYFLAIDWYNKNDYLRKATLINRGEEYTVALPFGRMLKCVANCGRAVWADSEDGEILFVGSDKITVQGIGKMHFFIAENGEIKKTAVDFSDCPVKNI